MEYPLHTKEKTLYCEYWKINATTFQKQGCYTWMAEQLKPYEPIRVLDVGCGTGEGLATLLEDSTRSIVAIEENFICIKAAERYLIDLGYSVKIIPRICYDENPDGRHGLVIDQDEVIEEGQFITLVHADLFFVNQDKPLRKFFDSTQKFDAVTLWLIGTLRMRKTCKALDSFNFSSSYQYRHYIQKKTCEIADDILRPGGVLQVVNRGLVPDTEEIRNNVIDVLKEMASETSLCVSDFTYREYEEPKARGISMTRDPSAEELLPDDGRRAMFSTILKKPK